jgi:hypothetical protein
LVQWRAHLPGKGANFAQEERSLFENEMMSQFYFFDRLFQSSMPAT